MGLSSGSSPIRPQWPSVCPSCAEALCSTEKRATSGECCDFNYRCRANIVAPSNLWGAARPGRCAISLQQLLFIFALCISLGDIKWHSSHSHLISFSGSCLWCDESFHLVFIGGWWRDRAAGVFPAKCIANSFLQALDSESKHRILTFPVCRKDDYGPITASLCPYAAHTYSTHKDTHTLNAFPVIVNYPYCALLIYAIYYNSTPPS